MNYDFKQAEKFLVPQFEAINDIRDFNQRKVLPKHASVSGVLTMHKKNATIFVSQ